MLIILFYIFFPSILVLIYFFSLNKNIGSDMGMQIGMVNRIKLNNHKLTDYVLSVNEKNLVYPQFFHWILSFFSEYIYTKNIRYIHCAIKFIEIISFNLFLFYLYPILHFDNIVFLYVNIIINVSPFSYSAWNAKNMGLSVRGFGLALGHIYLYFIILYAITNSAYWLIPIFVSTTLIFISSQFATQFVLFTLPFVSILFSSYELLILPLIFFLIFYIISPKIIISYLKGQYNFKRNYALFLAEIYILKERYSIWRDLVYDFWIKLYKEPRKIRVLNYIANNPVIEIIYGLPFLWFVFYAFISDSSHLENPLYLVLFKIICAAFIIFFLTTFRISRFLGEPQRYLEFVIPLISILFVLIFPSLFIITASILCVLFIIIYKYFHNQPDIVNDTNNELCQFLKDNYRENLLIASNDYHFLKYLLAYSFRVVMFDYTAYYKTKHDFQKQFYNNTFSIISPYALKSFIKEYKPFVFAHNNEMYAFEEILKEMPDFFSAYKKDGVFKQFDIFIRTDINPNE